MLAPSSVNPAVRILGLFRTRSKCFVDFDKGVAHISQAPSPIAFEAPAKKAAHRRCSIRRQCTPIRIAF
jgi:hypothetical protein